MNKIGAKQFQSVWLFGSRNCRIWNLALGTLRGRGTIESGGPLVTNGASYSWMVGLCYAEIAELYMNLYILDCPQPHEVFSVYSVL